MNLSGKRNSFFIWIGLNTKPDYDAAPALGRVVGAVLLLVSLALLTGGLAIIVRFLPLSMSPEADSDHIRNIGLVVAGVVGAPFVVWRAVVAQRQADIAEQSHITDQINKAVAGLGAEKTVARIGRAVTIFTGSSDLYTREIRENEPFDPGPKTLEEGPPTYETIENEYGVRYVQKRIVVRKWQEEQTKIEWQGSTLILPAGAAIAKFGDWSVFSESVPNIEVRIGAVYALERIAQDSTRDHVQIMEILCAYVRENAPARSLAPTEPPFPRPRPRADIQVVLDVIGRRPAQNIELEKKRKFRVDLRNTDLSGANFTGGNFEGAIFLNCRLEAAVFDHCSLVAARLNRTLLNFASFFNADLRAAIIDHAVLSRHDQFTSPLTLSKDTRGLSMAGSDLSALRVIPRGDTNSPTFATKDTKLSGELEIRRSGLAREIEDFDYFSHGVSVEDADEETIVNRLAAAGFLYWSPYDSTDGTTSTYRLRLWRKLGFVGFPYED